ncbi:MAG: transposase [Halioglobus sp.]|nr:transposase [Halioglobus sp.]
MSRDKIDRWLKYYNEARPHRALNNMTALEFVARQGGRTTIRRKIYSKIYYRDKLCRLR